ncbi:DUF397 domain-containing protein [Streptomyces millisiae]|uniref:DUF397 domain-containing protein n=1 Tax=Streptomyces millisiae TaxID=3075542 RepID=A0ABU2LL88_9ACTN|nr:DUF397 domain-containing protein [Streptomyces sp. DSM 44918]MDT0318349.1 DUF397 domain-containing protein [Streptomyces sp. DSM 44918]
MTRPTLSDARWFKSSASDSANGCLEVAFLDDGRVAIRDNEDLANPPFLVTRHVWECFIAGAAQGEFDPPVSA